MLRNRVIVADDQTTFSERLRRELEPDFKVVASVRDGRALVQACDLLTPDIVICDADVPVLPGLDAIERLRHDRFEGAGQGFPPDESIAESAASEQTLLNR